MRDTEYSEKEKNIFSLLKEMHQNGEDENLLYEIAEKYIEENNLGGIYILQDAMRKVKLNVSTFRLLAYCLKERIYVSEIPIKLVKKNLDEIVDDFLEYFCNSDYFEEYKKRYNWVTMNPKTVKSLKEHIRLYTEGTEIIEYKYGYFEAFGIYKGYYINSCINIEDIIKVFE